uniref:Response regulator n=1 Tax=Schlesneria paludicola TaxID=360056 RepID=A0A7C4QNX0_9PLAN
MIVLISRDLFFASKVMGTAQQLGLIATTVDSAAKLREQLAAHDVTGVILDLHGGVAPPEVRAAVESVENVRARLVAFGPHVDTAALAAARHAGFDDVLPRSRFASTLPELLRTLALAGPPLTAEKLP